MTTIVYDSESKVMAGDKQHSSGNMICTTTKVHRIRGCLVGASGSADACVEMVAWFAEGEDAKSFPAIQSSDYADLLVIRQDGTIHKFQQAPRPVLLLDRWVGIGSGRDFAIAGLACGLGVVDAVKLAARFDQGTGSDVDSLHLGD